MTDYVNLLHKRDHNSTEGDKSDTVHDCKAQMPGSTPLLGAACHSLSLPLFPAGPTVSTVPSLQLYKAVAMVLSLNLQAV